MKYTIAAYLRLSIEDDGETEESNSITSQRLLIREYIQDHFAAEDIETLEFCDDGYSGTNMDRPGIQSLLDEVKKNRIRCIIVKDISRFSRDYIDGGTYLDQIFPFMGVRFIGINDGYDSSKHKGSTIEIDTAFQTLLYDLYSKDTSAKVKAAFDHKYESGLFLSACVPFGYKKIKGKEHRIEIEPEEAAIVRRIFDMALEGLSSSQIALKLHQDGVPTPQQMRNIRSCRESVRPVWINTKVRNILNNRFYTGDMVYNKSKRAAVGSSRAVGLPRSEWKVIPDHHESIVSHEEYEKVVRYGPKRKKPDLSKRHPLVGIMECGGCGAKITHTSRYICNGKRYSYFACLKKKTLQNDECADYTNIRIVEELILKELNEQLKIWADAGEGVQTIQDNLKAEIGSLKKELSSCEKKEKAIRTHIRKLYQEYFDNDLTAGEYQSRKTEDQNELQELSDREKQVQQEILEKESGLGKLEKDMKSVIRNLHIEKLTKEVVETFIKKITVYGGRRYEIEWNFSVDGIG